MKTTFMRKWLMMLLVAGMLATVAFSTSALAANYKIVTTNMNFRAVPNGAIIGSVPEGAQVDLVRQVDGWDEIWYQGKKGWIHGGNIRDMGSSYTGGPSYTIMKVHVDSGYLALRTAKAYDYKNEIGKLYTGDTIQVTGTSSEQYWYVYAPSLGKSGYVNKDYLFNPDIYEKKYVKVNEGYLALRTAKAYAYENEIGALYTGDYVNVYEKKDSEYWYVYSPTLGKYGYVNKNFLTDVDPASTYYYTTKTVVVSEGYLALRTAKAYDYTNEIGKLYTGEKFYVSDTSDPEYWYGYAPSLGKSGYVNKNYLK